MGIPRPVLLLLYEVFNFWYDHVLYPAGEAWFGRDTGLHGIGIGWAVMASGAVLTCGLLYGAYKYKGFDLVGVGYLEELPAKPTKNWLERLIARQIAQAYKYRSGPRTLVALVKTVQTFFTLITVVDPYLVSVFYERDRYRNTQKCDWLVFGLVVAAANLWWGFLSAIVAFSFLLMVQAWEVLPLWFIAVALGLACSMLYAPPNPFLVEKVDEPAATETTDYSEF